MKKVFVVTPVASEEATILEQIERLCALQIPSLEVVFVIDGFSRDRTREIIRQKTENASWVHLFFFRESTGVASCYLIGMRYALEHGADQIIVMDAGLSHDPDCIPRFVSKLDEGYDCVFSSRFMPGGAVVGLPWYRYALSRCGTILANVLLGTRLTDMSSGYEAFQREALERLSLDKFLSIKTTHFFHIEMRFYCSHFKIAEIPIVYRNSSTSLTPKGVVGAFRALWQLHRKRLSEL